MSFFTRSCSLSSLSPQQTTTISFFASRIFHTEPCSIHPIFVLHKLGPYGSEWNMLLGRTRWALFYQWEFELSIVQLVKAIRNNTTNFRINYSRLFIISLISPVICSKKAKRWSWTCQSHFSFWHFLNPVRKIFQRFLPIPDFILTEKIAPLSVKMCSELVY